MELPKLKKIIGVIPLELFDELDQKHILGLDFDNWLAEAIQEKLRKSGEKK